MHQLIPMHFIRNKDRRMESTVAIKSNSNTKLNLPGLVWNGSPDTETSKQNKCTSQLLFIVYKTKKGVESTLTVKSNRNTK
jgi:hypothetical protein